KSDLNVFTLDGSKFSSTNSFSLKAPAGSTVIVNVTGNSISLQNFGMQFSGVDKKNVVFNFVNATSLTTTNFSFQGSVLAPQASYKFNNGNLEGTLIAASVSGTGEFHNYPFSGNLPSTSPSSPSASNPSPSSSPSASNPSPSSSPSTSNPSPSSSPSASNPSPSPSASSEPVPAPEPVTIVGTMLGGAALSFLRRQRKG
ncbi:MAG TPA: choice-of-anchor A family protein, partial [Kamptonema sp.]|nr:choice-of-anchor A family protein [Kamptonema sp.]